MTHRYALAAVLVAALSVPAAAQQTTQPDTSKKSKTTVTESAGAIADTTAKNTSNTATPEAPAVVAPATGATVTTPAPTSGNAAITPAGVTAGAAATGAVQPTAGAAKVQIKVAPSLANTVKISADSAFALARASNTAGEISSAELEMTDHRLVYQVKMVKGNGASTVYVDAMTGEVVKDKKFGGMKAAVENAEESQKLIDAKKDSAATKKP